MRGFLILSSVCASVATLACSPDDSSSTEHYVDLADIRMYYEAAGSGAPLVLLHGGFGSSDAWDEYFPLLSDHTVITPDSRGQGRTSIGDGPLTYGRMAGDVLRLLDHLGIGQAHFVGHSDGGCILLHLLIDYPDRVASATLIGAPYHTDNYSPQVSAAIQKIISSLSQPETAPFDGWKSAYMKVAPQPEMWPELVRRLGRTWLTQPKFSDDELGLIDSPVLIVKVDKDQFLPPSFFDRSASLIPGARLIHLPDGTHSVPREKPRELADAIRAFVETVENENKKNPR